MEDRLALRVEALTYEVEGRRILEDIWLEVQRGEIFTVMGPSGCGKTTFLKTLIGLLRPVSGRIWILGHNIVGLPEEELNQVRRRMGFVFQYAALFDSLTVGENVAFGLRRLRGWDERRIQRRVREVLGMVGLSDCENLYPAQLSGGMRKRVGLARAIAHQPEIVLYDEPSSGLDPVSSANIDRLIVRMRDELGVTSVIVSHHVASVFRISDRLAMMHQGRLLMVGTPLEFRRAEDERIRQFLYGRAEGPLSEAVVGG